MYWPMWISTRNRHFPGTRPNPRKCRAGDGIRTRDPQLGRLMLYQLSYSRLQMADGCAGNVNVPAETTPARWTGEDSNLRSRKTLDLQSSPVDRFGTCPYVFSVSNARPQPARVTELAEGFEPPTCSLQVSCSTS